jgi:predicted HTH transcriptional regulator
MTNIFTSLGLTQQARIVLSHMERAGSISARDAMNDYGITSATLSRRICDLKEAGIKINSDRRRHPLTGKLYTRYSVAA